MSDLRLGSLFSGRGGFEIGANLVRIDPKDLIIPLDTHVHQVAIALDITQRKQADMRTATEITNYFKGIFPGDPALGDFALFGAGVNANK